MQNIVTALQCYSYIYLHISLCKMLLNFPYLCTCEGRSCGFNAWMVLYECRLLLVYSPSLYSVGPWCPEHTLNFLSASAPHMLHSNENSLDILSVNSPVTFHLMTFIIAQKSILLHFLRSSFRCQIFYKIINLIIFHIILQAYNTYGEVLRPVNVSPRPNTALF